MLQVSLCHSFIYFCVFRVVLHGKIVGRASVPILIDNGTNDAKEATFLEDNSDFEGLLMSSCFFY